MAFKFTTNHERSDDEVSETLTLSSPPIDTTPLLADEVESQRPSKGAKKPRTPLPLLQLAIICFVRIAEPVA